MPAGGADEVCTAMIVLALWAAHASIAEPRVQSLDELPEELIDQVVKSTDTSALCDLMAVGKAWCPRARHELSARLCSHSGGPTNDAPWAGRELPNLARLHGYGYEVDLSAVRQAIFNRCYADKVAPLDSLWAGSSVRPCSTELLELCSTQLSSAQLSSARALMEHGVLGRARTALRDCFTPSDSMPPRELMVAALACAGKGTLLGIPVEYLRDVEADDRDYLDELGQPACGPGPELDLSECTIDADGMQLLALLLPGSKIKRLKRAPPRNIGLFVGSPPHPSPPRADSRRPLFVPSSLFNMDLFDVLGRGTYTTDGITKLCEGLKGSAVNWIECAATPYRVYIVCSLLREAPHAPVCDT